MKLSVREKITLSGWLKFVTYIRVMDRIILVDIIGICDFICKTLLNNVIIIRKSCQNSRRFLWL